MTIPSLPQVNGLRVIRALEKAGFILRRQKGSHAIVVHQQEITRRAVIPVHGSKTIKPGTLRSILKGASLTVEEFRDLLK